jgi:F420H(2)-dependent quinone reductase
MKHISSLFFAIQVGLYKLSKGKLGGRMLGFDVLLLTTTGRKTGKTRTVPLGLFDWQGEYLIVASNNGAPKHPAWYINLKAHPQATVQVLDKVLPVTAEVLTGETRLKAWQQVITCAPSYAAYKKKTSREIPLIVLHRTDGLIG